MADLDVKFGQRYRERAEQLFPEAVEEVRIFGSRARGDAGPDSDLDLFVLMRDDDRKTRIALMDLAWDVFNEMQLPYVPVAHVMTHSHWEMLVGLECRLARDIQIEGVLL